MKRQILVLGWLLSGAALPAFAAQTMDGMEMHEKTVQASHQGVGKVVSVNKAKLTVKLEHEAIKSLGWPGMTMDFRVAKAALLEGLKAGDAVRFELKQTPSRQWEIVGIERR